MRNDAWPIHVMQICPGRSRGNAGGVRSPTRFVKSDGISTVVRKLRRLQAMPGLSPTRVERVAVAPFSDPDRVIFRFFEKGIGTRVERYNLSPVKQKLSAP